VVTVTKGYGNNFGFCHALCTQSSSALYAYTGGIKTLKNCITSLFGYAN